MTGDGDNDSDCDDDLETRMITFIIRRKSDDITVKSSNMLQLTFCGAVLFFFKIKWEF